MTIPSSTPDAERIRRIQSVIRQQGETLRSRYPILAHQDAIGLAVFLLAVSATVACGGAYVAGLLPAWLCIPLVAFFTALLHELEHDLIHWQYFRRNRFLHHFMLFVGWLLRPGTINPWVRRHLHFLHHKVSGTAADIEERGIGNGQPYTFLRFWIMADTFTGNLYRTLREAPRGQRLKRLWRILLVNFPFAILTALVWYGFLAFHGIQALGQALGVTPLWPQPLLTLMPMIDTLVVILIAPFYLRSFSLNFISSTMHYYGNVRTPVEQTQVLDAWYWWPLQIFCCNFGSTHGIHHFVVGEPFYIRQLTAPVAHRVMRENGVRFNDLGTFRRANRCPAEGDPIVAEAAHA